MAENKLGRFVWYDLATPDPDGAQAFYTKVVGWGTMQWDGPMPYTMWTHAPQAPLGGIMPLDDKAQTAGAPPHWLAYVSTPDCAATAAKAVELGGKVLKEPSEIPATGMFAVLTDPQGAEFAVYQSTAGGPEDKPPELQQFSWHELATTDWEAGFDFYARLFGWSKTDDMDMGEMGTYRMFGFGQWPLGGMFNKPPEIPAPGWLYYVKVPDVNAAAETVKAEGGKVLNGPMEVPGGDMIVQCVDPQGAAFALHSAK
ncbi:MAG TPA: VOC family protein [Gemmatimonadales bacterium]